MKEKFKPIRYGTTQLGRRVKLSKNSPLHPDGVGVKPSGDLHSQESAVGRGKLKLELRQRFVSSRDFHDARLYLQCTSFDAIRGFAR